MVGLLTRKALYCAVAIQLVLGVLSVQSIQQDAVSSAASSKKGMFVWQGFDYTWLRTMLGFNTPHRLGPFEARVDSGKEINNYMETSASMQFDVGVDGDYSHPQIFTTAVAGDNLWISETVVHQSKLTDSADHSSNPEAHTKYTAGVSIPRPNGIVDSPPYTVLLQGVKIGMHCDQSKQDDGDKCNSNGMWPTNLTFDVNDCAMKAESIECNIAVEVSRAWTPTKGGLKPFNYKLDLDIQVGVTALGGTDLLSATTPEAFDQAQQGSVHDHDITSLTGGEDMHPGSAPGRAVVGIRGFSIVLKDDKKKKQGRYLQRVAAHVGQAGVSPDGKSVEFRSRAGYLSPKTVYDSTVIARVTPVLMQFTPSTTISPSQITSRGTVCKSGLGFSCSLKKLEETTACNVPVADTPLAVV